MANLREREIHLERQAAEKALLGGTAARLGDQRPAPQILKALELMREGVEFVHRTANLVGSAR